MTELIHSIAPEKPADTDRHSMMPRGNVRSGSPIDQMIERFARLPGLGPRSARRIGLHLLRNSNTTLESLIDALRNVSKCVETCQTCGNIDCCNPCLICQDTRRDSAVICVVEEVGELWALERAGCFRGQYHVLGGTMSGLNRVGPEDISIDQLLNRVRATTPAEVILGLSATLEGQTTSHYLAQILTEENVLVTRLAHGIPVGGELDYLDSGTISAALSSRQSM